MIRGLEQLKLQMAEMAYIFDPTREYNGIKRIASRRRRVYDVCIAMTRWRRR